MAAVDDETKSRAYRICQEFLGGTWTEMPENAFCIEHIRLVFEYKFCGGLSNLLYCCSVAEKVRTKKGEVRKVMLRIYGQIILENPEMVVTDSVIFALLAEKGLGPKLHGVFTGGRVEEYISSRHLMTNELRDPAISVMCAKIMARFHTLRMPLCKKPMWLFNTMSSLSNPEKMEKLQTILSYGLEAELKSLKNLLSKVNSPVVFCHNDLQEGNILYSPDSCNRCNLLPIDFEYSSYNYRGFDIGNHFCEWCYDYSVQEPPYFSASLNKYPTREQQLLFVRAYLDEKKESEEEQREAEEQLLLELNAFALASHFLWGLWSVVQAQISDIKFGYLDYGLVRFDAYFIQKDTLTKAFNLNGI
ncbi:hypothetical protein NP493_205g00032 [Ridgeia piscesae]|uniref:Choline/ethanolamine kinase n=1 Tax=Ridgeia piscesae TaxID=27915 RepID=A0AAD9P1L3_RIDPI|nr:hypothetical protein NP493_205g00032 [Ridgeia piscesae]